MNTYKKSPLFKTDIIFKKYFVVAKIPLRRFSFQIIEV